VYEFDTIRSFFRIMMFVKTSLFCEVSKLSFNIHQLQVQQFHFGTVQNNTRIDDQGYSWNNPRHWHNVFAKEEKIQIEFVTKYFG